MDLRFGTLYFQIHPPSCLHPLPTQTDLGPPVLFRARRIEKIPHARLPSILPSSRTLSNVADEGSPGLHVQALCSGRRLLYRYSHLARLSGVGTMGNPVSQGSPRGSSHPDFLPSILPACCGLDGCDICTYCWGLCPWNEHSLIYFQVVPSKPFRSICLSIPRNQGQSTKERISVLFSELPLKKLCAAGLVLSECRGCILLAMTLSTCHLFWG